MSLLFNVEAEIQRQRRESEFDEAQRLVIIGNGIDGDPYADDNHLWVRDIGSKGQNGYSVAALPYRVLAGIGPTPEIDKQVWIEWQPGPRKYQVKISDPDHMQQTGRSMHLENPSDPHNQFHRTEQLMPLLSLPVGGMKVNVQGWQYINADGDYKAYKGTSASGSAISQHVDFTSHRPATTGHHCYALIVYDTAIDISTTDPLDVFVSTSQAITTALNDSDIQECVDQMNATSVTVKAYRLVNGMTEITGHADDRDLRGWLNLPGSGSGAIVLTSPEGTIDIATYAIDVADGAIDTSKLADDAVNGDKLAAGSVDSIHIIDGAVGEAEIATDAVTPSKIPDSSIPLYKHAPGAPSIGGYGGGVIGYDGNGNASEIPNAVDLPVIWGENVADGDFAYLKSDGKWWKADADAGLISSIRGVVIAASGTTVANNPGVVRIYGRVDGFSGLTNGGAMYLSNTPGGYTQTEPTPSLDGATVMIARYGHALSADAMFVDTRYPILYRTYVTSSADEETSVTHHANVPTQSRTFSARTYVYDETSIESYASSNQNADKQLKGQSGAGGLVTVDSAGASLAALGNNGSANFILAQSISATAGFVSQATVSFGANTGSPVGTVTASLHLDDGTGKPAALALESVVFTPTASSNNTITFAGTTFVSGTIWLKLAPNTTQASTVRWNVNYSNTNPYASGVLKADSSATPGTWATFGTTQDMRCSITTTAVIGYDRLAQGFSHSSSANILSVKLWLRKVGSATGNLTLSIFSNNSGVPNTVITNGTSSAVDASTLGTSYAWVTFTFPVSPAISASTQYHLVLSNSASASNTNYVEWGIDTSSPGYANGVLTSDTGGTWSTASPAADGIFDVIAQGTQHEEDLQPGQWSGGVGQYGVRRGDSSGANKNTITRFKNISSESMPIVYDVSVP